MEWYEPEVRALERLRVSRKRVGAPVVFYGSSTIRLWSTLARDLGDPRALNLGFGGSTLEACFWFFDRLVPPEKPSSLVVYAGDNDLGDGQQPDAVVASFRALAARVLRWCPGIPFGFISIKPSPARRHLCDKIRRTNEMIRGKSKALRRLLHSSLRCHAGRSRQSARRIIRGRSASSRAARLSPLDSVARVISQPNLQFESQIL